MTGQLGCLELMNDGEKMLKMDEPINKERHRDER
jgi:hypothetical protein